MSTISIVIPAKDEADYLPRLLAALDRQTRKPDEVIVADADSIDETADIARRNGAHVVSGGLPSVGRNSGAAVATSDLIFFVDADAVFLSDDFLAAALAEFERRGLDIATCDVAPIGGNAFDRFAHGFYNRYVRAWGRLLPHAPGFCILVRKSLHEAINGFDESIVFCEDHDYVGRANKLGVFGFLNDVKVGVTMRRQERDGRVNMAVKYVFAELHIIFLGPIRHNGFRYGFGYHKE